MRIISYIIKKEFRQIFRNKMMIPIIFVMPIVQMLILVYAATFDMKNLTFSVLDNDHSQSSRQLTQKIAASPFFIFNGYIKNYQQAENQLISDHSDIVLIYQPKFEETLLRENKSEIQILINAINGTKAGIAHSYLRQIIAGYNQQIISKYLKITSKISGQITTTNRFWYNPELNYKVYMIPGILGILITVIGMMLSGLNLVREKEIGTIDQINVTPIKKHQFIIGKLIPFLLIALFDLSLGLTIAKLLFDIPMLGSLATLFTISFVFLLSTLGLGLFISTIAHTQQQVIFIAYFMLIIFILMGGLFTPAESMPRWAQQLNWLNPIYFFMRSLRMILLKGSTLADLKTEFIALLTYGITILSLAIVMYRKRS